MNFSNGYDFSSIMEEKTKQILQETADTNPYTNIGTRHVLKKIIGKQVLRECWCFDIWRSFSTNVVDGVI